MVETIARWWNTAKRRVADLRSAIAWAAFGAFMRAVFGSIIDTLGWGPFLVLVFSTGGVALVTALAGAPWYWVVGPAFVIGMFLLVQAIRATADLTKQRRLEIKGQRNGRPDLQSLDNTIEFEWNPFLGNLTNPPRSQYVHVTLVPVPVEMMNGGGISIVGVGGAIGLRNAFECKVINHSKVPIFNVSFELQCVFKAADHDARPSASIIGPDGSQPKIVGQGAELLRRPWRISASRVDDGSEQPFTFYIDNPNDVWVDVFAPEEITFERLGSSKKETVRFIAPYRKTVTLSPPIPIK